MSPVPGRQVDDEEVGIVPVDVGEELLERLVQHRAPPDDRLVLLGEEAHRDAAHAVGLGRARASSSITTGRVRRCRACAGSRSPTRRRRRRRRACPAGRARPTRLVVTDDLPTPPLPDAISEHAGALTGRRTGSARPSAWPAWLGPRRVRRDRSPWSCWRSAARSSSVMTREVDVDPARRRRAPTTASVTRLVISFRSGQPATVRATATRPRRRRRRATPRTMPRSTMRAVQLGVLDRAGGPR